MTGELMLRAQNVGVYYTQTTFSRHKKKFWALKDVSFDLHRGETLGLIGANGAGKSSLIKVLAGIIAPDKGNIESEDLLISRLALDLTLLANLSGRQNAMLSGMLLGLSKKEIQRKLDEIIAYSELGNFIDQPVKTYSSGMRARLSFSVAIHSDPDILLIDEMFGVGDESFREKSANAVKDLVKSDKTVVLVSHNLNLVRELSTSVLWLEDQQSREVGDADVVIKKYIQSLSEKSQQETKH